METYTDILLVTANVGSLFDNVSSLFNTTFVSQALEELLR